MVEFKCTQCECVHKHRSSLANHTKLKHSDISPAAAGRPIRYKCCQCGIDFSNRSNLDRHIRQQHGQSFNCTLCGKGCTCERALVPPPGS